jgi:hypothetical protein
MKRLKKIILIVTVVAVMGVLAFPAVAYAQEAEDGSTDTWNFFERIKNKIAEILGISTDEYQDAIDKAKEEVLEEGIAEGWLTQKQADSIEEKAGCKGPGMKFFGRMGGFGIHPISVFADILDMEKPDLLAELKEEKTIEQIAEEKGMDKQTLVDSFLEKLSKRLDDAVADEDITRKFADSLLQNAEDNIEGMINTTLPAGDGFRGGMGKGFLNK